MDLHNSDPGTAKIHLPRACQTPHLAFLPVSFSSPSASQQRLLRQDVCFPSNSVRAAIRFLDHYIGIFAILKKDYQTHFFLKG